MKTANLNQSIFMNITLILNSNDVKLNARCFKHFLFKLSQFMLHHTNQSLLINSGPFNLNLVLAMKVEISINYLTKLKKLIINTIILISSDTHHYYSAKLLLPSFIIFFINTWSHMIHFYSLLITAFEITTAVNQNFSTLNFLLLIQT